MTENVDDQSDIDVALVTGLSGAGLSTAAKVLEDMGWYVADNLPPELITRMVDLGLTPTSRIPKLAVVIDIRSRRFSGELAPVIKEVAAKATRTRVLFLEASDPVLVRRFEHNRRSHPLQSEGSEGTLIEGIASERVRLASVRAEADLVIDTSALSAHELRHRVEAAFGGGSVPSVAVTVQSFGFKYGLPMDADLVCDVRFLPNPHWVPELREHTGQDAPVRDYVLGQDGAEDFLDTYHHVVELTTNGYRREGKRYMTIAVGCTGGKHRSVAMTEALAARIAADTAATVKVVHRDLGRE
ncbi:RNase adapter RapZ [Rhodococcus sp. NPDC003318]|uniref:RNase adapter RapZ n=1 Tax=Rhodococcus sp. NPDC003318 TaxID=3364503 RepID=UPI0036B17E76